MIVATRVQHSTVWPSKIDTIAEIFVLYIKVSLIRVFLNAVRISTFWDLDKCPLYSAYGYPQFMIRVSFKKGFTVCINRLLLNDII